jgi:hypothetical protein
MFPMLRVGFALLFGWAATMLQGQTAGDAAAQLASRISSLLPRGTTVSLEFQTLTPLSPAESSSFRGTLQDGLRKVGVEITATAQPESSRVRVFVSENAHGRLLVAEISTGETRQMILLPWSAASTADARPRITITKKPIWTQAEPILDVLLFDSDTELLVLGTSTVAGYRWTDGKWTPAGIASFSPSLPVGRDPRGRIEMLGTAFHAYLPGTTCAGELTPALKISCSQGNASWMPDPRDTAFEARWISGRNLMESNDVRGAFYSTANGLFANPDGKIADRAGERYPEGNAWGSDIAAAENPCGSGAAVIATAAGDDPSRDQVQIHEIANGHATPGSDPLALPGHVTALWPSETKTQATLVVRNPKTGEYEAYRLGLACAE